jgi:hypothetical protein
MKRIMRTTWTVLVLTAGAVVLSKAQSTTTGTLNLRNGQPATVSLTLPTTGVTGYKMELPATIGAQGEALTVSSVSGTTATLGWTSMPYWSLSGSSITTGGTGVGQQFIGTSNTQDLVLAANAAERLRIVGTAGPTQGYVGIGTATPKSSLDVQGDVLLSNSGSASLLKFQEPTADGSNTTSFKAQTQATDITYTLPATPPSADGQVMTATTGGVMAWTSPTNAIGKGRYTPVTGEHIHVINTTPYDIKLGDVVLVTVMNAPGTTISASVTAIDDTANTITVETSTTLGPTERLLWIVMGM